MKRIKSLLTNYFRRMLFVVRVDGESMYPSLIPGRVYLASNLFALRQGDFAVFRNPKETGRIFVKRVEEIRDGAYIMESSVSWGSSSRDFGPVDKRLVEGKIWR